MTGSCLRQYVEPRFSIWYCRAHDICGLVVNGVLREAQVWLLDEGLEWSRAGGMYFARRLREADRFAIIGGVVAPVDLPMLDDILTDGLPACLQRCLSGRNPYRSHRPFVFNR